MRDALRITLLGELGLSVRGEVVPLPSSKKTRALLGYLVLAGGEHTRSRLCDLLWDGPADPRAALRWALSKLRPLVDDEARRIRADRENVSFELAGASVDLFEVREVVAGGLASLDVEALEACCDRFQGEVLEGLELEDCFGFAHWLAGEREKARNLHTQLLSSLTKRLLDDPERGLAHARAWVALEPLDEAAHARWIEMLIGAGRREEARRAAGACSRLFQRELGRLPGRAVSEALKAREVRDAVEAPAGAPAPDHLRPLGALGLFGRADECCVLEELLESTTGDGAARVLWLSGEPGIGKSRLLAELLERARQRGATTCSGKAYEAEVGRPLALWSEVLGGELDPDESLGRTRLFEEVRGRLRAAEAGSGLVIALDDLQWVDEASAALASWLVREGGPGLVFAMSARPGELEDNPAARRLHRALLHDGRLEVLEVGPLGVSDATALMRSINPEIDTEGALASAGGNPLFAIELARMGGAGRNQRLRGVLSERLGRLTEAELELVRAGAAMGRRFSLELVSSVTGLRTGELLRAAERLEVAGMVRPAGSDEFDFAHDLMRRAAYDELSEPARRLLHRRIARALAEDPRAAGELSADLARQASLADEHLLAASACVHAGERSLRLFANEEATSFARRGLKHASLLDPPDRRRLSVELLAIEVHTGLGRRNRADLEARLARLVEAAKASGEHEPARTALYLLSVLDEESGEFGRAEARSLEALEEGRGADPETETRALANTGRCLAQLGRELSRAELLLRETSERGAPGAAQVDLAWGLGLLAWHRGELGVARQQLGMAFEAAQERGNHWAAFECLSRLAIVDLASGEPSEALGREAQLTELARRLEGGSEGALTEALMALSRKALDPNGETLGAFERALDRLRAQDSKAVLATLLNQAASLELARGEPERARAFAEEALDAARIVGRERQVGEARRILEDLDRS